MKVKIFYSRDINTLEDMINKFSAELQEIKKNIVDVKITGNLYDYTALVMFK